MKKYLIITLLICATGLFLKCSNNNSNSNEKIAKDTVRISEEECSAINLFPIKPPSNAEPDSGQECQFYQWAWATFLYITQDTLNKPRFLSYETPSELFSTNATPLFAKKLSNKMLLLAPRLEEDSVVTGFSEVEQAISKSILVDKNGRVIYYAQHVNSEFVDFVKAHNFMNMDTLFAADPNLTFPKGCLELKSSWKIVMPGDDVSSFYTTKAMVAQFETKKMSDGKSIVVINPQKLKEETVALLGIHVVGITDGHPEFIWATFEHDNLAPNNNNPNRDPENPSTSISGTINDTPLDSKNKYLFYQVGTSAKKCNVLNPIEKLEFANEKNQTFKNVSSVFHQFWFDDDSLIESLNKNVHIMLGKSSVWTNYSFKGAVWINNPKKEFLVNRNFATLDNSDNTIVGGEKALSNVTMETFTQDKQRCFSCHKTKEEIDPNGDLSFPPKLISVSHVLTNAYFNTQRFKILNKIAHK